MHWARYVLVNQALRGRGMRSTTCPSSFERLGVCCIMRDDRSVNTTALFFSGDLSTLPFVLNDHDLMVLASMSG